MSQGQLFADEMPRQEGERWSSIADGKYAVSNHGRVLCYETGNILNTSAPSHDQYPNVHIDGQTQTVHSLVMQEFGGSKPTSEHTYINHLDNDRTNNHIDNLEWVTPTENRCHGALTNMVENQTPSAVANKIREWAPEVAEKLKGEKEGRGRPRALDERDVQKAVGMRRRGKTFEQGADYFGVSRTTVTKRIKEYAEKEEEEIATKHDTSDKRRTTLAHGTSQTSQRPT